MFGAALVFIILSGTGAIASLSNSGGGTWKYQREISIKENSGTALTDYQVLIELKGVDFPNEAKSDGTDIRFADSKGNELNYWIESWDYAAKSARIWVIVQSIPASLNTIIRMYYGNPAATQLSNGDKTFDFFDDFSGDLSKWTAETGDWSIINQELKGTHSGCKDLSGIIANYASASDIAIDVDVKAINWKDKPGRFSVLARYKKDYSAYGATYDIYPSAYGPFLIEKPSMIMVKSDININPNIWNRLDFKIKGSNLEANLNDIGITVKDNSFISGSVGLRVWCGATNLFDNFRVRKYTSPEPTTILASPKSSSLSITKSASPYSLRQFQESTIKVLMENSGTSEVRDIEIMDSIHPAFDLTGGDFPNPKKFDSIRAGESRELQYTIRSKESGAFTLDPANVTYADSEGNIQEVKSEPVSIKVVPSSDEGSSGTNTWQNSKSASVSLHGEKTDVVMGEDILLRLSAVNLITKPKMHVQVIIIPPSGMSVTSSEFSKSAAGQFTANYQLEPGDGKDIEVRIRSNQVGDFNVNGRIIYYFGDEKETAEDHTLNLPIKVRSEIASTPAGSEGDIKDARVPGFEAVFAISMLALVLVSIRRM